MSTNDATSGKAVSAAAPFRHKAFAVVWTATLVSNIRRLDVQRRLRLAYDQPNPDPLLVALVQAASNLPIFLFAIPAGALADILDKRKFLILVECLTTAVSAVYAMMVGLAWPPPAICFCLRSSLAPLAH